MRIWVLGSLNVDLVVTTDRMPDPGETVRGTDFGTYLGGKGGNQAMALARLGAAPKVLGRVGSDQFGAMYRDGLQAEGADVSLVTSDPDLPTGTALIEVDTSGNNRIVVVPGANGTVGPDVASRMAGQLSAGDLLLMQLEIPMDTVRAAAAAARERGAQVMLDPAPAAELSDDLLKNVSWLTPNEHEAAVITGVDTQSDDGLARAAGQLAAKGVEHVVIKAGARGALYLHAGSQTMVPGFSVDVVDTTAAGDSFNGGLAWALSRGKTGAEAIRMASAVAAISVTGRGAQSAMPRPEAVFKLLRS